MQVSIIITNHNYADYVGAAIESALDQGLPDKEVIVVDDGSTDDSRRVIDGFGDDIRVIYQERSGQCAAINAAFAISSGRMVALLDADDYYLDADSIARLTQPMLADDGIAKSQGCLRVIDRYGTPTGSRIPAQTDPSGSYRELILQQGLGVFRHSFTSGSLWARWFLDRVMPLPEHESHGADGFLNTISPLFGSLSSSDLAVAAYRIHGRNIGPTSSVFTAASLRRRVEEGERNRRYLVDWARKLDLPIPNDQWRTWSWRHSLRAHVLGIMDGCVRSSFLDLVSSPFKTYQTGPMKRVGIATVLGIVWALPRTASLELARYMLGLDTEQSFASYHLSGQRFAASKEKSFD